MGSFTKKMKLIICLLVFVSVYSSSDADACDKNVCFKDLISNLRNLYRGHKFYADRILAVEDFLWEYLPLIQNLNVKAFIDRLFRGGFGNRPKELAIKGFLNPRQMKDVSALDERIWKMYLEPADRDNQPLPGSVLQDIQYFEWILLGYLDDGIRIVRSVSEEDLNAIKRILRNFRNCNPALMNPITGFISKSLDGLRRQNIWRHPVLTLQMRDPVLTLQMKTSTWS